MCENKGIYGVDFITDKNNILRGYLKKQCKVDLRKQGRTKLLEYYQQDWVEIQDKI